MTDHICLLLSCQILTIPKPNYITKNLVFADKADGISNKSGGSSEVENPDVALPFP